jgi:hypothetical protein
MTLTDRYGLTVTTASPAALEQFQEGMDRLLAYGPGAEESFAAALQADPGLAVAYVGRALLAAVQGDAAAGRARPWAARPGASGSTSRR